MHSVSRLSFSSLEPFPDFGALGGQAAPLNRSVGPCTIQFWFPSDLVSCRSSSASFCSSLSGFPFLSSLKKPRAFACRVLCHEWSVLPLAYSRLPFLHGRLLVIQVFGIDVISSRKRLSIPSLHSVSAPCWLPSSQSFQFEL